MSLAKYICNSMQHLKQFPHVILFTQKIENPKVTQDTAPPLTLCLLADLHPKNVSLLLFSLFILVLTQSLSKCFLSWPVF
jgi:hypothetical protein